MPHADKRCYLIVEGATRIVGFYAFQEDAKRDLVSFAKAHPEVLYTVMEYREIARTRKKCQIDGCYNIPFQWNCCSEHQGVLQ